MAFVGAALGHLDIGAADTDEYALVFEGHHRAVYRLAYLMCADPAVAEDATAEAFARVYPRWRAGQVDDVGGYLRQTVVNQIRGGFRRRLLERREGARRRPEPAARFVDDQAADREDLARALRVLAPGQRVAIVLRYFDDLTEAQTAEVMGTSVGTVKSQVSRGLDRLRAIFDDRGEW